jgi:hypothetical protein
MSAPEELGITDESLGGILIDVNDKHAAESPGRVGSVYSKGVTGVVMVIQAF